MLRLDYDEYSPITGEKTVLVEYDPILEDTCKFCMKSGYETYESWTVRNAEILKYEEQLPDIIRNSKKIDSNGNIWYKTTMNTRNVILYPKLNTWVVAELNPVMPMGNDAFAIIYVDPETGKYETKYVDETTELIFGEYEFEDAIFAFQQKNTEIKEKNEN